MTPRFGPRGTVDVRADVKQCPTCERRFSGDAAFCPFDGVPLGSAVGDPKPDDLLGTVIDNRYRILEVLGEGGMGRVYKVNHLAIDRTFAMKVLRSELACDEALAMRFLHEAKVTASVKHPNVVQITDYGRQPDGTPYFVMELLAGQTLGQRLREGPLPLGLAIDVLVHVASGAGAAHEAGIVHRDLKPDNVVLLSAGDRADVRVVDFGASKVVGTSGFTRAGIVFGTPQYMSPEQASGSPVDARSDIYALGVIMYEMLTGRPPFVADSYMGVLTQHMFATPVPPSEVGMANADLGIFEGIALRCLEKKPEARFASMSELAGAIEALLAQGDSPRSFAVRRGEALPAGAGAPRNPEPRRPSRSPAPRALLASSSSPPRVPFVRFPVALALAAGCAVLLGGLVGVAALWSPRSREPSRAISPFAPSDAAATSDLPGALATSVTSAPSATSSPSALQAASSGAASANPAFAGSSRPAASATHRSGKPRLTPPAAPVDHPAHAAPRLDDVGDPFAAHP